MFSQVGKTSVLPIISYTPPQLYTGKDWYVGFYAYDPSQNKMRRKRIKLNFIKKTGERRKYAGELIKRLNTQLVNGWNPWIEADNSRAYHTLESVFEHYRRYLDKMFADDIYRKDTYDTYISYLKNVESWNNSRSNKAVYIYQFDQSFVRMMLEHIYLERESKPQTRDNYLRWMKVFSSWLIQNQYLKVRPTDGFISYGKKSIKKSRSVIPDVDMKRIKIHVEKTNKHYLLSCYMLYYCFVRPKEIGQIQISHISLKRQTLFIPDVNSKNKKDGTLTLPAKVIRLMLELNIFKYPSGYFLFSNNFMPGKEQRSEKQFRDFWFHHVRKKLDLPASYKFYSLKDTGITAMLRTQPSITVRDQARHSSLLMTDKYTPHDIQEANELIKNHETYF
jgi:integrase